MMITTIILMIIVIIDLIEGCYQGDMKTQQFKSSYGMKACEIVFVVVVVLHLKNGANFELNSSRLRQRNF